MATATKDTLYIDAEDEITAVIEKLVSSKHKIVAVVLPKRATVFQSVVNMKLLQRAAKTSKKNLVLVTSDKSILSIAAATSVMVAKTPTSKPAVPIITTVNAGDTEDGDEILEVEDEDSIEMDNSDKKTTKAAKGEKSDKKLLKIPDFSSFRLRLGLGITALVVLVALWFIGFVVMPKATVVIRTDVSTIAINATVNATVGDVELDAEKNILPAQRVQVEKIDAVTVEATGEKDVGTKATGLMTLTNCIKDSDDKVIAPGTTFSSGNVSFVTSEQIILKPAVYFGSSCISGDFPGLGAQGDVAVEAAQPGTEYNVSGGSFNSSISGISAFGSAMTGGTSKKVKVVSQEDVDRAKTQLSGKSKNEAIEEMKQQLGEKGLRAIDESLDEGKPVVEASPGVGKEASETKVTMNVTYNMIGVNESDISAILDSEAQKNLGERQQNVRDNGLSDVRFSKLDSPDEAITLLAMETVAKTGPDIDPEQVKQDVIGKKRGEIEKQLESIEGVRSVSVEYSPVWVTTTPKSAEKITVVFEEQNDE